MMIASLKSTALQLVLPWFARAATDVSHLPAQGSMLVIAPHQDDDILSCGGSILRARAADQEVRIIFVTDGSASTVSDVITPAELSAMRRTEARNALMVLGVGPEQSIFLDIADGYASGFIEKIADRLAEVIGAFKPAIILSPYPVDPHPDHRAVARALQLLMQRQTLDCLVLEYPRFQPASAFLHLLRPALRQRLRRVETRNLLDVKRKALARHVTQCENVTGEAHWEVIPPHWTKMFFQDYELFLQKSVSPAALPR